MQGEENWSWVIRFQRRYWMDFHADSAFSKSKTEPKPIFCEFGRQICINAREIMRFSAFKAVFLR